MNRAERVFLLVALMALALPSALGAKEPWQAVSPQEWAMAKSSIDPDAPAEALVWRINVYDDDYPRSRRVDTYVRYKIYDPEKADRVMRLAETIVTFNGTEYRGVELAARLSLPDGTVKDFGREAVRERDLVKKATADSFWGRLLSGDDDFAVKEKFLAVGGAVPGSVLEFHTVVTERLTQLNYFRPLQFDSIPTRQLTYRQEYARTSSGYFHQLFTLNPINVEVAHDDANRAVTITAHDIGALRSEPLAGPWVDRTMTLVDCYFHGTYVSLRGKTQEKRHFTKDEPWAPIATLENWIAGDHVELTKNVKKKAAELAQEPATPLEKAKRIHDFVTQLHQQFVHAPPTAKTVERSGFITGMDEVLSLAAVHPQWLASSDFLWLALSLYRAAGLQAEILMLPNRDIAIFDRRLASPAFLSGLVVAVHLGDSWHFSLPNSHTPLAFDELPWEFEGMGGLLGLDQKQDFIEVPLATPEQSVTAREGEFRLDGDGTLSGQGTVSWRGHEAYIRRGGLFGKTPEAQRKLMQQAITDEFDGAEILLTDLRHVADPNEPLEAAFTVTWTGFGVPADGRMIFRPFVFRTRSRSPFSASERHGEVVFPFRRLDTDKLTIALPAGYTPEAKAAPPSFPGPQMSYQVGLALDAKHMILHVTRDFSVGLITVPPENYKWLKSWYDAVTLSDAHNLVLLGPAEGQAPPTPPATTP